MRDDQQGRARLGAPTKQQVYDLFACTHIEIAGGLVSKDQLRARCNSTGNSHTLLLTAGQLRGIMFNSMAKADRCQLGFCSCRGSGKAGQFHWRRDIFNCGHGRQEMEGLQHNPDAAPTRGRKAVFIKVGEISSSNRQITAACSFKAGQHRHQRAFARTRWAEQSNDFAMGNVEIDTAQDFDRRIACAEGQSEVPGGDRVRRGACRVCHRNQMG